MSTDPTPDATDLALRQAIRERHARFVAPRFEETWATAERLARAGNGASQVPAVATRRATGGAEWSLALAACAFIAWALLVLTAPPDGGRAPTEFDTAAAVDRVPLALWYAPTDRLLEIPMLSYGARPAQLTTYDPITMEVRP